MMLITALLLALGVGNTIAVTLPAENDTDLLRRDLGGWTQGPKGGNSVLSDPNSGSNCHYTSSNWAGLMNTGTNLNYLRGTVVVPTPNVPADNDVGKTDYVAFIWVGIDGGVSGDSCKGIIQGGLSLWNHNGTPIWGAWWAYHPITGAVGISQSEFPVSAGDTVRMSIWAFTHTDGQLLLENLTKGVSYKQKIQGSPDYPLCRQGANWIVEDPQFGNELASFPNFGSVSFTDTYTNKGDVSSNTQVLFDIAHDKALTKCSTLPNAGGVKCVYL